MYLIQVAVVAPALLLLGTPWIPESPRWLAQNGKDAQALSILQKLHGSLKDNGHDFAGAEFLQIRRQLELDAKMPRGIIAMIQVPSYRKRFLCGLFVQCDSHCRPESSSLTSFRCLAQSTGALVITNYQVGPPFSLHTDRKTHSSQILIYKSLGITGWLALLLFGVYSSWAAFLNWAGSMVVDLVGRIRMLTFGIVSKSLSCPIASTHRKLSRSVARFASLVKRQWSRLMQGRPTELATDSESSSSSYSSPSTPSASTQSAIFTSQRYFPLLCVPRALGSLSPVFLR